MSYIYPVNYIFDLIASNSGFYGFFANPGFGTTTLMMQIVDEINKRKNGTAIVLSLELSADQWKKRMQELSLSTDRVVIFDNFNMTTGDIEDILRKATNVNVLCIDYITLLDGGKADDKELSRIAEEYGIPIVVNGKLCRDSGDYDEELRPELCSLPRNINPRCYDFLALLHRKHKCERNVGTAHRYDIQSETELIIKRNGHGNLGSAFMEWEETQRKFNFNSN